MRPRYGARAASAADLFSRIGDYVLLLGCIALTVIVVAGLSRVGVRKVHLNTTVIGRIIAYPLGDFTFPALTQPQKPQESTLRQSRDEFVGT